MSAFHGEALFVSVPLVVDASKDEHVEDQEDAAHANGDGQGCGGAVVVLGGEAFQEFDLTLSVVQDAGHVAGTGVFERGGAGSAYRAGLGSARWEHGHVPFVSDWTLKFFLFD